MLRRHLRVPHEVVCVTDNADGIDPVAVRCWPLSTRFANTPRCRRRMQQYSADFARDIRARRILSIDLDVVILDDLTPIVDRSEPIVCWRVGYAGVFSGSFVMYDAGALDGLWRLFDRDPEGFPRQVQPIGIPSDQAMLNFHLRDRAIPHWTDADGFVPWFGDGYERFVEAGGMGPNNPTPPPGARIVVLGSADKAVMDGRQYPFVVKHWR